MLVLDDDAPLRTRLGRALESRGFETTLVGSVEEAVAAVKAHPPAFAVLDMRLEDGNGLEVVEAIHAERPDARVIMLTGYGNIATAVAAVKAGAVDYLPKPADADDVARALLAARDGGSPAPPENPMSRRPGAVGAHPARLRALQPQRLGDRATAEHAPPHPAADPGQARPAVTLRSRQLQGAIRPDLYAASRANCRVSALRRAGASGRIGASVQHRAAEAVGDDQARAVGEDLARELRRRPRSRRRRSRARTRPTSGRTR